MRRRRSRRPVRLLAEAAEQGARLAVFPGDLRAALPLQQLGEGRGLVRGLERVLGAPLGELGRRPGPPHGPARRRLRRARGPLRDRRQRAGVRAAGVALQRPGAGRPGGRAVQAPEADADHARAPVPRRGGRRRPGGRRHPGGAARRPGLLGEHDAAGPLRRLSRRPADLAGANRGRHRRLAREHASHRARVGRLRRLGSPVHPGERVPGRLPRAPSRGQGGVRQGRRGDRRARRGRGDRRPAVRRGGDGGRRL